MSKTDKKIQIFESAIKCIAKYGVEKANAQNIASDLGIAQSGVFYHFPTREELFDSLIGYIVEKNHQQVLEYAAKQKAKSSREQLLAHLEGNLIWAKKNPDQVGVLLLSAAKTARSKKMKEIVNTIFSVGEDRIYRYLSSGVAEKEFSVVGSIRRLATFLHHSLMGIIVAQYVGNNPARPHQFFQKLLQEKLSQLIPAS